MGGTDGTQSDPHFLQLGGGYMTNARKNKPEAKQKDSHK
jgi:hypothetical protein